MVRCSAASSVVTTRVGFGSGRSASTMPTKCGARKRASSSARRSRSARATAAAAAGRKPAPLHPRQHHALPRRRLRQAAPRVEARRTLRQRRQERGLRRRQHRAVAAEVGVAGALGAGDLVAVRREVQVQREDLRLGQPMLEAQRDDRLLDLRSPPAPPRRAGGQLRAPIEQQLRHLLRQRRAALDAIERGDVAPRRARHRDRIDAPVRVEAMVLGGQRRRDQRRRQPIGAQPHLARAEIGARLVEHLAVAVEDGRRAHRVGLVEQAGRQRARGGSRRHAGDGRRPRRTAARHVGAAPHGGGAARTRGASRRPPARCSVFTSSRRSPPSRSDRTPPARTSLPRAPAPPSRCRRWWRGRCRRTRDGLR